MRIGELSAKTGVSQRMLRYYEQEELLAPERSSKGYRVYSESTVVLVRHIRNLSEAGMKLNNIRSLLPCISGEVSKPQFVGCPEVKAILQKELQHLDVKLRELSDSRNKIADFLLDLVSEQGADSQTDSGQEAGNS